MRFRQNDNSEAATKCGKVPVLEIGKFENFLSTRNFGSLDGLRAFSILAVLWHHAGTSSPNFLITSRGFLGVDLFFVISGFLIITLLLRDRDRAGAISLRDFYIRRVLRIFPAYYLMLLIVGAWILLRPESVAATAARSDLPYAALFLTNLMVAHSILYPTWSLSVEEQFYILMPALENYAGRVLPFLIPFAYGLVCLPPLGFFSAVPLPSFFRETTFGPILLGVALAHALNGPRGFGFVFRLLGWRLSPFVAMALVLILACNPAEDISGWPRIAIHWAMLALVASCILREDNALAPALKCWPVRRLGIVSYGIYLYHLIVMGVVVKVTGTFGGVSFLFTTIGTWAAAELSFRFFETPFLSLRRRFAHATQVSGGPSEISGPETSQPVCASTRVGVGP